MNYPSKRFLSIVLVLLLVYFYWSTPMFIFPESHTSDSTESSEVKLQVNDLFFTRMFLRPLAFPSWPVGVIGIIGWIAITHSVFNRVLS